LLQLLAELHANNKKSSTETVDKLRQDENDLKKAENLAENLLETANTLIVILDDEGLITSFNSYAEQLTGYAKAEVLGKNWFHVFIPNEKQQSLPEVFRKALQNMPEVSEIENCIVLKNGDERLISWRNNVVRNHFGNIIGTLSIGVDITEYRQAEDALQKSKKRLQSYLTAIDDIGLGLFVVDDDYCIRDMNQTMIAWFGDQRGQVCYNSVAGLDKPCTYCRLEDVLEQEKTVKYKPTTPDGRIFEIVATPIDNQDGGVSKLEIIRDITEQEQALNEIKELSCALEQRVQERTVELEQKNEQLQHNKQEIEKKNIALRVLLDQQQATREEIEEHMALRLKKLVYPYLALLHEEVSTEQAEEYIKVITAHLDTMTTSFVKKLNNPIWHLTSREVLVADLVHQGKSTKEIGRLLKISPRTAERYRNTIRKKIGLTKKKISLHAYLNSFLSPH
jgi:PAS domain S-box-containing protein